MPPRYRHSLRLGLATLLLATAAVVAWRAARAAGPDPSPFLGTWICPATAQLTADCGGAVPIVEALAGTTVAVRAGADGAPPGSDAPDLALELGCHCRLPLAIAPADPTLATLVASTPCELVINELSVVTTVTSLTMRLAPAGATGSVLSIDLRTGPTVGPPTCAATAIVTTLSLASSVPADCGPEATAIGVIPYDGTGFRDCPLGAGREGLELLMYDDPKSRCEGASGERGDGFWGLPQRTKDDFGCRDPKPNEPLSSTFLQFCRIDGRVFKPLTTDPTATELFYAVLKVGDGPCPSPAIEMVRRIDNAEQVAGSTSVGHLGPNQVWSPNGPTSTTLHFCYFRWAATLAETMTGFPDVGFPYAVFHDYEGPQPPWVTLKAWIHSSDAKDTNHNTLTSPVDDAAALVDFQRIIETPEAATTFDVAWVR